MPHYAENNCDRVLPCKLALVNVVTAPSLILVHGYLNTVLKQGRVTSTFLAFGGFYLYEAILRMQYGSTNVGNQRGHHG